MPFMPRAA